MASVYKQVALGVTGGIAAYKAAELVRLFQDQGLEVQVIMTQAAQQFVAPLTFAALSGRRVITRMFDDQAESSPEDSSIEHISLAQRIDALVIAPATANMLAKLAHGMADDFLTLLALATRAPLIVAPAMNVNMWEHAATRANVAALRARGCKVIEPDTGILACGMTGAGRLADVGVIAEAVLSELSRRHDLQDEILLITAGPTREPLDPVRYLGNRSSGKMGFALAEAAHRRGAHVVLVCGPTLIEPPSMVETSRVETAEQMAEAVLDRLCEATAVVMAAAVADYHPVEVSGTKIKKRQAALTLELEPTRDVLGEISLRRRPSQLVVGFAAETGDLLGNARAKLQAKRLDLVVANDVTQEGAGFDVDTNIATLVFANGQHKSLPRMSKLELAHCVLDEIVTLRMDRI
jgi:phosphopantothenoylcysteine decarboxylase / phosphopantothenate---cysteine ligase